LAVCGCCLFIWSHDWLECWRSNGSEGDKAMRQELIEEAVGLLAMGDLRRVSRLGATMTEQEKSYVQGIVEDMKDDNFDVLMGKPGASARLNRREFYKAAKPKLF
jgi:hypothetical protein